MNKKIEFLKKRTDSGFVGYLAMCYYCITLSWTDASIKKMKSKYSIFYLLVYPFLKFWGGMIYANRVKGIL